MKTAFATALLASVTFAAKCGEKVTCQAGDYMKCCDASFNFKFGADVKDMKAYMACQNAYYAWENYTGIFEKGCANAANAKSFMALPPKYHEYETVSAVNDWKHCSKEDEGDESEFCECQGEIRYGADGKWAYMKSKQHEDPDTHGLFCDNSVFGDPNLGVNKDCYCRDHSDASATHTEGGTAPDGSECFFPFVYNDGRTKKTYDQCVQYTYTEKRSRTHDSWCYVKSKTGKQSKKWGNCGEAARSWAQIGLEDVHELVLAAKSTSTDL